jgi:hypothetical protein
MRGFRASCDDLLQDVPVQTEICDQALQLVVFVAKLSQFSQFVQAKTQILLLPETEALLADPMLAADLDHRLARFRFPQNTQNLFFRMSPLTHPDLLLVFSRQSRRPQSLNFKSA